MRWSWRSTRWLTVASSPRAPHRNQLTPYLPAWRFCAASTSPDPSCRCSPSASSCASTGQTQARRRNLIAPSTAADCSSSLSLSTKPNWATLRLKRLPGGIPCGPRFRMRSMKTFAGGAPGITPSIVPWWIGRPMECSITCYSLRMTRRISAGMLPRRGTCKHISALVAWQNAP